jgi:hypothetical protein
MVWVQSERGHAAGQQLRLSKAPLDELVEEALVDAAKQTEACLVGGVRFRRGPTG